MKGAAQLVRLADYCAPAWHVDTVALDFDLGIDRTELAARMVLRCTDADAPLQLDGENLELLAITLDGQALRTATLLGGCAVHRLGHAGPLLIHKFNNRGRRGIA